MKILLAYFVVSRLAIVLFGLSCNRNVDTTRPRNDFELSERREILEMTIASLFFFEILFVILAITIFSQESP